MLSHRRTSLRIFKHPLWCFRHLVPLTNLKPVNPVPAWNITPSRKGNSYNHPDQYPGEIGLPLFNFICIVMYSLEFSLFCRIFKKLNCFEYACCAKMNHIYYMLEIMLVLFMSQYMQGHCLYIHWSTTTLKPLTGEVNSIVYYHYYGTSQGVGYILRELNSSWMSFVGSRKNGQVKSDFDKGQTGMARLGQSISKMASLARFSNYW